MNNPSLAKPGNLIRARGREWVVLPDSSEELLYVRPVGGLDEETVGIMPTIESVESASFPIPSTEDLGDFRSGWLLREAARLSTRAAAGPFRSFARIAVEPRPYQLVPLIMALQLDPVRLLIADDVGIGKTIEAAVVARELLDRAEIRRIAVLCPPHLAEQWQRELFEKFHIEAELVLSNTIQRLERNLPIGVSVFDRHRFVVVSTDFIKSERRAADFELKCPEFVIVDEAHTCTVAGGVTRGRQQRFDLIRRISKDPDRHIVLVTATPHSGKEEAFRSLLGLLNPEFFELPTDLSREERDPIRRKLARHLVQRRRGDIQHYLETDTAFPSRKDKEETYTFSGEYRDLFDDIVKFAREIVSDPEGGRRHQRVRFWSALALLRCVSSSPAAAVATLSNRSGLELVSDEELDDFGRRTILDNEALDDVLSVDFSPGSEAESESENTRSKLLAFARRAKELVGDKDRKVQGCVREIKSLLKDGFHPIVFCRFMDTADYVARELRQALPDRIKVESVTGTLPPAEREQRIESLVKEGDEYVLVCTDCLSEGINLQEHFDAVIHYDLAWNPTRHEQREGRVDRFNQDSEEVRVITYYGEDNPIDGVILEVLIRKHKSIKSDLGVAVAVPGSSEKIAEALFEGALFREMASGVSPQLTLGFDEPERKHVEEFHSEWENARDQEKASRSRFAQHAIHPEVVAAELKSVRDAIGRNEDVAEFFKAVLHAASIPFQEDKGSIKVNLSNEVPRALRQAVGLDEPFTGRFDLPAPENESYLGRTSPIVEGVSSWVLDQALDPAARESKAIAARCGVIATSSVDTRTTLIVARFRYHLRIGADGAETILCEEIVPMAFTGSTSEPEWLDVDTSEKLLRASPDRNLIRTAIDQQIGLLMESLPALSKSLPDVAKQRAAIQLEAHERARKSLRSKKKVTIEPVLPIDILGAYILLPRIQ